MGAQKVPLARQRLTCEPVRISHRPLRQVLKECPCCSGDFETDMGNKQQRGSDLFLRHEGSGSLITTGHDIQ